MPNNDLFHSGSRIKYKSNQNVKFFCLVLNNIGFPISGKLIRSNFVLAFWCVCVLGSNVMKQHRRQICSIFIYHVLKIQY